MKRLDDEIPEDNHLPNNGQEALEMEEKMSWVGTTFGDTPLEENLVDVFECKWRFRGKKPAECPNCRKAEIKSHHEEEFFAGIL